MTPYLLPMLPALLLSSLGTGLGLLLVLSLLCCVTLVYNMINAPVVSLIWYLYSALSSSLYFGNYLLGAITNYTLYLSSSESQAVGKTREDTFPCSFTFPRFIILLSSRLITIALENFGCSQQHNPIATYPGCDPGFV